MHQHNHKGDPVTDRSGYAHAKHPAMNDKGIQKISDNIAGCHRNHSYYDPVWITIQAQSPNSSPEANNVGDNCTIWYDPAKPENAQPFHYDSNKIYNIILIIGIVMVLLGIILTLYGAVKQSLWSNQENFYTDRNLQTLVNLNWPGYLKRGMTIELRSIVWEAS